MQDNDFSGIWQSKYTYHSDSRNEDFEDTHFVRIYQRHNKLVVESLPDVNESYVIMNLKVNDDLATGTWQETTSPTGYYKGATYHGALQLIIESDGKFMEGKWIGHGKDKRIESGPLSIKYVGKKLPAGVAV
jgi:hypothetical protein